MDTLGPAVRGEGDRQAEQPNSNKVDAVEHLHVTSVSPGVPVAFMVTLSWWAGPVLAVSVMVMWTSANPDIVTLSQGSVCIASETQLGDTVRSVSLVTMETLWSLKTVKVRFIFSHETTTFSQVTLI